MPHPDRRQALAAGAALTGGMNPTAHAAPPPPLIKPENPRPGTPDWQLTYAKFDGANKFRQSLLEGYCDKTSVAAGETIRFCVSASDPTPFKIDVYRLGYYQGTGGRHVRTLGPF